MKPKRKRVTLNKALHNLWMEAIKGFRIDKFVDWLAQRLGESETISE